MFIIDCSTSEIIGSKIGSNSSYDTAAIVFEAIHSYAKEKGIYIAVQGIICLVLALVMAHFIDKNPDRFNF